MSRQEAIDEINAATTIVVIQAENPDGDSLGSALALEAILHDQGKQVKLYCPVQIPKHLRFMAGWDRVEEELPNTFDASIIVDTSSAVLLEKVFTDRNLPILRSKPTIVIDHHTNDTDMPYQTTNVVSPTAAATSELLFEICREADWDIPSDAANAMSTSIMFDTLGLTTQSTTTRTIEVLAELTKRGADLAANEVKRRALNKKSWELTQYKADLITRIELKSDGRLAEIVIPWEEIEAYSDQYNPSMLVLDEMRLIEGVEVAIAYKLYPDGKITAKIRCNDSYAIGDRIAEHFGGGGHPYAAGFKVRGESLDQLRASVVEQTEKEIESYEAV